MAVGPVAGGETIGVALWSEDAALGAVSVGDGLLEALSALEQPIGPRTSAKARAYKDNVRFIRAASCAEGEMLAERSPPSGVP
jgi:hypothetical protein